MTLNDDSQKNELFLFASLLTLELSLAVMAYERRKAFFDVVLQHTR